MGTGVTPPTPPVAPSSPSSPKLTSDPDVAARAPSLPADDEWGIASEPRAPTPSPGAVVPPPLPATAPLVSPPASPVAASALPSDVQERIQAVVREAVEDAIAPIRRWQKDVEVRLERGSSPSTPGRYVSGSDDPFAPLAPLASSSGAVSPGPASPPGPIRIDVPLELDGGRRHRTAGWILAMVVLLILTVFFTAMIVSQTRA